MFKSIASMAIVAAAVGVHEAQAHVYLTQPLAEFKSGASKSSWVAEFAPPWSGEFKTGAQYAAVAPGKGYKDLRSFLEDKGPVCGNSLQNASPKPIPSDGTIKLASSIEHAGPCEVWLDNTRAFYDEDCEKTFAGALSFKMDFSACKGSCLLRFYWLGLQDGGKRWQSYKNCVPLGGGGGGSSSNNNNNNSGNDSDNSNSAPAPAPTPKGNSNSNSNGNSNSAPAPTPKPKKTKAPKTPKPKKTKKESRSIDDEEEESYNYDDESTGEEETYNYDHESTGEEESYNYEADHEYAGDEPSFDDHNATFSEPEPAKEEFNFDDLQNFPKGTN